MQGLANLETGVLPKRVASDSLLASSKLCFLPLAETLDCLDCLDCRQLADVRLLPVSLCLVASLEHGVHDCAVRHTLVPKTTWGAKAFRPWQQCKNGRWIHISEKKPSSLSWLQWRSDWQKKQHVHPEIFFQASFSRPGSAWQMCCSSQNPNPDSKLNFPTCQPVNCYLKAYMTRGEIVQQRKFAQLPNYL